MTKILALAGSTRHDSWNQKLIRAAAAAARSAGAEVTLLDLKDYPLPLYDGDLEAKEGLPEPAQRLKSLFKAHDALLIAGPEYNSSISPLLKNTLDWVSREWQGESGLVPYQNKVAAIMAASPGALGGMRMLPHLRQILNALGVLVLANQLSMPKAGEAFNQDGSVKSPERLDALVTELVRVSDALSTVAEASPA
ncbi:MAG: NADPH-dependent FMN reductase [Thiobacillus sp.]